MVRKGSPVRVRQRALAKPLEAAPFLCRRCYCSKRRGASSRRTGRTPRTRSSCAVTSAGVPIVESSENRSSHRRARRRHRTPARCRPSAARRVLRQLGLSAQSLQAPRGHRIEQPRRPPRASRARAASAPRRPRSSPPHAPGRAGLAHQRQHVRLRRQLGGRRHVTEQPLRAVVGARRARASSPGCCASAPAPRCPYERRAVFEERPGRIAAGPSRKRMRSPTVWWRWRGWRSGSSSWTS